MQDRKMVVVLLGMMCVALSGPMVNAQEKPAPSTAEVHVVITDMALRSDTDAPRLKQDDVKVKQGKTFLQVTQLIPAKGDNAALQLMILIDDTLDPVIGGNLNELKEFIQAQPRTTVIAIGYMSNATVNIVQNFTADHDLAVKAVRLPRGMLSTMDSPYLSLISVVKGWPQQKVRREVLMFSDGIDRLRGVNPAPNQLGPAYGPVYHTMPQISVDASSASEISQRYNVIVSSMYAVGVGRRGRSAWDIELGLGGLSKIAEETGGECYSLGITNLVSFKPYLERFQRALDNQYYLVFLATPKKKAGLQRVSIQTEVSNSEIAAPDNVWVPEAK
jgi:hypothetical protein